MSGNSTGTPWDRMLGADPPGPHHPYASQEDLAAVTAKMDQVVKDVNTAVNQWADQLMKTLDAWSQALVKELETQMAAMEAQRDE